MRPSIRCLLMISAAALAVPVATTMRVCAKELAETEQRLLADAADGSLDEFSLLEGALIASGVTDWQRVERYCDQFADRVEAIAPASGEESTVLTESERIYHFLHSQFLTGKYESRCTEIDRALDAGDYNCVTATILYNCVCQARDLSPVAVATDTHVRSRFLADQAFDVETTCREWFDVVRRDPPSQALRTQQQITRPLSDIQLVAKIYYNRGVSLLETKDFDSAIDLLRISQSLDPADKPTRENIAAGMNNWALAESDAGNFERAADLVQRGWEQHPDFLPFSANDVHIHQRWAVALCEEGRFAEAMLALRAAHLRRPDVALFDRGRLAIFGQWATALLEAGDCDSASQLFEEAANWFDDEAEVSSYQSLAIQTALDRLTRAGRDDRVNRLVRWGLDLDPTDPRLHAAASRLTTVHP